MFSSVFFTCGYNIEGSHTRIAPCLQTRHVKSDIIAYDSTYSSPYTSTFNNHCNTELIFKIQKFKNSGANITAMIIFWVHICIKLDAWRYSIYTQNWRERGTKIGFAIAVNDVINYTNTWNPTIFEYSSSLLLHLYKKRPNIDNSREGHSSKKKFIALLQYFWLNNIHNFDKFYLFFKVSKTYINLHSFA